MIHRSQNLEADHQSMTDTAIGDEGLEDPQLNEEIALLTD